MNDDYNVLVLGPGGIKGFQELGALYFLETNGKLNNLKTFLGVSVGAIICFLLNVGFTIKEIIYIAVSNSNLIGEDLSNLSVDSLILTISNLNNHMGLFSTDRFRETLNNKIIEKLGFSPTFKELKELTNKELVIVCYNLSKRKKEYFSFETNPNTICLDAVMMSMNIPLIFFVSKYNDDIYIDGAFGDPYPILIKDDGANRILGIYIELDKFNIQSNILCYIHEIVHSVFDTMIKDNRDKSSTMCSHIPLKSNVLDITGSSLSIVDKAKMILCGIEEARTFLNA